MDRLLSIAQERIFDLRYGTDTVSFVELDALTIQGQNAVEGTPYEPTRLRHVRRILSAMHPMPESAFVDFGCGKGRVLLLASAYPFRRITGVEFAKELCETAKSNITCFQKKSGSRADIRIVEGDAAEYEIQEDENYFFMFNPFSAALMERVVGNIARSLAVKQREGFVIYNNPLWASTIEKYGFTPILNFNHSECIVFRYDLESEQSKQLRRRLAT